MKPQKLFIVTLVTFLRFTMSSAQNATNHLLDADTLFRPYLIGIVAADLETSLKWYEENLGFKLSKRMAFPKYDSLKIVFLKQGNTELELIEKKTSFAIQKFVPNYDGFDGPFLIGISKITFWVSDATQLAKSLKTRNVKFIRDLFDDKQFGLRTFFISDPDGNVFQFNQRLILE